MGLKRNDNREKGAKAGIKVKVNYYKSMINLMGLEHG